MAKIRSKEVAEFQARTPEDLKIFARHYAALVVRIGKILEMQGITQAELAKRMEKQPSEISKWLNGEHNFTLRSIAKLEAELGEKLLYIPKPDEFVVIKNSNVTGTSRRSSREGFSGKFISTEQQVEGVKFSPRAS